MVYVVPDVHQRAKEDLGTLLSDQTLSLVLYSLDWEVEMELHHLYCPCDLFLCQEIYIYLLVHMVLGLPSHEIQNWGE